MADRDLHLGLASSFSRGFWLAHRSAAELRSTSLAIASRYLFPLRQSACTPSLLFTLCTQNTESGSEDGLVGKEAESIPSAGIKKQA